MSLPFGGEESQQLIPRGDGRGCSSHLTTPFRLSLGDPDMSRRAAFRRGRRNESFQFHPKPRPSFQTTTSTQTEDRFQPIRRQPGPSWPRLWRAFSYFAPCLSPEVEEENNGLHLSYFPVPSAVGGAPGPPRGQSDEC